MSSTKTKTKKKGGNLLSFIRIARIVSTTEMKLIDSVASTDSRLELMKQRLCGGRNSSNGGEGTARSFHRYRATVLENATPAITLHACPFNRRHWRPFISVKAVRKPTLPNGKRTRDPSSQIVNEAQR